MTAEDLDKLLRQAGIALPPAELGATLPGAQTLLAMANQLPKADSPDA